VTGISVNGSAMPICPYCFQAEHYTDVRSNGTETRWSCTCGTLVKTDSRRPGESWDDATGYRVVNGRAVKPRPDR
jgi:hypothetical protein